MIEKNHNELLTNMSSVKKDFEITLKCLSTISATCNIYITMFANQNYKLNSEYKLTPVDAPNISEYEI